MWFFFIQRYLYMINNNYFKLNNIIKIVINMLQGKNKSDIKKFNVTYYMNKAIIITLWKQITIITFLEEIQSISLVNHWL